MLHILLIETNSLTLGDVRNLVRFVHFIIQRVTCLTIDDNVYIVTKTFHILRKLSPFTCHVRREGMACALVTFVGSFFKVLHLVVHRD